MSSQDRSVASEGRCEGFLELARVLHPLREHTACARGYRGGKRLTQTYILKRGSQPLLLLCYAPGCALACPPCLLRHGLCTSVVVLCVAMNLCAPLAGVSGNRRSCGVEPLLPPGF